MTETRTHRDRRELEAAVTALDLTESEAVTVASILGAYFDWAGSAFTGEEICGAIDGEIQEGLILDADQYEQVIEHVRRTPHWTDAIADRTSEVGWELLDDALCLAIKKVIGG